MAPSVDQRGEQVVGREAELAVRAEAELLFGAVLDRDVGLDALAGRLAAEELVEHLVGHRVLQHRGDTGAGHEESGDLSHLALRSLGWF